MKDLEHNIKEFYMHKALSDSAIERILQGTNASAEDSDPVLRTDGSGNNAPRFRWLTQYNLAGLTALVASLVLVVSVYFSYPAKEIEELVYTEVAMNHNKQLDVEYFGNDYPKLALTMSKLDFPLISPRKVVGKYSLIGGRYCSIQGALAAQLKVKNRLTGEIDTLYVTPLTKSLSRITAQKFIFKGIEIELWQTDELFYALASTQAN